jgi:hypothetical protein
MFIRNGTGLQRDQSDRYSMMIRYNRNVRCQEKNTDLQTIPFFLHPPMLVGGKTRIGGK